MKIAVVAPSPVPFMQGGAEAVWWNLVARLNEDTPHAAELIKLPSPERNLPDLLRSYEAFSRLDLRHFDMIITGKYPAWMVQHPNHVVYMLHRLRGLYDTYPVFEKSIETPAVLPGLVLDLHDFMACRRGQAVALPEFFARAQEAVALYPDEAVFPGPLARRMVHWLDDIGLQQPGITRFAAISRTIATRPGYFPPGKQIEVAYPPSSLPVAAHPGEDGNGYFFTCSRLDGPKRIGLLIQATLRVPGAVLKIAGTGPEQEALRAQAAGDARIEFLGFVNEDRLSQLYADALAVLFVPQDEDYGLIAIEAMRAGKPLITARDSGGPNELVRDGETGFSTEPDPGAIAAAMATLLADPARAQRMGEAGRAHAAPIGWSRVIDCLLEDSQTPPPARPSLCVATTFPIYPPRGGGQSRVFNLYRHLARHMDVTVVAITNAADDASDRLVAPGLREIKIPKSRAHHEAETALTLEAGGVPVTDVAMPQLIALTPSYGCALAAAADGADAVVACHPYLLPAIRQASQAPLWYEAQDAEFSLKASILPDTDRGRALLAAVRTVEHAACDQASLIFTCAEADTKTLARDYGFDAAKAIVVPNGVDTAMVPFTSLPSRAHDRQRAGIADAFTALFIGSWHQPNIDAVEDIIRLAPLCPDISFLVLGSVGRYFTGRAMPDNVGLMNEVDDSTLQTVLRMASCAINPMQTGSGTNLKMLDYFASGVPVLSTPHGARGLDAQDGVHLLLADMAQWPDALRRLRDEAPDETQTRIIAARRLAEEQFDWGVIADRFHAALQARGLLEFSADRENRFRTTASSLHRHARA